jgi:hypothetical protein
MVGRSKQKIGKMDRLSLSLRIKTSDEYCSGHVVYS